MVGLHGRTDGNRTEQCSQNQRFKAGILFGIRMLGVMHQKNIPYISSGFAVVSIGLDCLPLDHVQNTCN